MWVIPLDAAEVEAARLWKSHWAIAPVSYREEHGWVEFVNMHIALTPAAAGLPCFISLQRKGAVNLS